MENHSAEADDENDLHQVGQIIYREGEENISDDDDVRDYEDEWEEEDDDDEYLYPPAVVKILGGEAVNKPGQFPHQVSLQVPRWTPEGIKNMHFCGATVIHPLILLTAAHCLVSPNLSLSKVRIVAGEHDLSRNSPAEQIRNIGQHVIHPGWDNQTWENDIALLMLDRPLSFDQFTKPIPFATSKQNNTGLKAYITGWGKINNKPDRWSLPTILRKARVQIRDVSECESSYSKSGYKLTGKNICAGGLNDPCEGDSGGPLTCVTDQKEKYICGIVSWGRQGCVRKKDPGVYTDVSAHSQWILKTVRWLQQGQAAQAQGCDLSPSLAKALICASCATPGGAGIQKPIIESVHVQTEVKQRFSLTKVTSTMVNPDINMPQDVTFSVLFPDSALISELTLAIDGTVHKACMSHDRNSNTATAQTQQRSRGAGAATDNAGIVESSVPNSNRFNFTKTIDPATAVTFTLTYEELLVRREGFYMQTLHIDTDALREAQHYNITVKVSDSDKIKWIRAFLKDSNNNSRVSIDDELKGVVLHLNETNGLLGWSATEWLKTKAGNSPQQFILQFDTKRTKPGDAGKLLVQDGHFVHFFPTQALELSTSAAASPKHFIFLLDISSSMSGGNLGQVQDGMANILDELTRKNKRDYFNIITFDQDVTVWTPSQTLRSKARQTDKRPIPLMASRFVKQAKNFIRSLTVRGGGWDLHLAFKTALNLASSPNSNANGGTAAARVPFIFLVTSATSGGPSPTGTVTSLDEIQARIAVFNAVRQVPIFSLAFVDDNDLGISTSKLFPFLRKLSLQNYGRVSKINEGREAVLQLEDAFLGISSSVSVAGIRFTYSHPETHNVAELAETESFSGYYFRGSEIVVAGKVFPAQATQGNGNYSSSLILPACNNNTGNLIRSPAQSAQDFLQVVISVPSSGDGLTVLNTSQTIEFGKNNNGNNPVTSAVTSDLASDNFVARVWAYLKLQQLLKETERLARMNRVTEWKQMTDYAQALAVNHGFLTPWTSLVFRQARGGTEIKLADHVNGGGIPNGIFPTSSSVGSPAGPNAPMKPNPLQNIFLNVLTSNNNSGFNNGCNIWGTTGQNGSVTSSMG